MFIDVLVVFVLYVRKGREWKCERKVSTQLIEKVFFYGRKLTETEQNRTES